MKGHFGDWNIRTYPTIIFTNPFQTANPQSCAR